MSLRTEKVASLIKEEVGMYLTKEFRDPTLGFITVTEVIMTPDLKIAKIYVSIMGSQDIKASTMQMIENHKGEIRSMIGSNVRLKFTPYIQFYVDETYDRVDKINQLLNQIHKNEGTKDPE